MTIPENVRDVALKVTSALHPSVLAVIIMFILNDVILFLGFRDLQDKRIDAVVELFKTCTAALAGK